MRGGVWYPAATGYWFHQYAEIEELSVLLSNLDFACTTVPPTEGKAGIGRLRCERSFRLPGGVLSRTDVADFSFRRNGAVVSAESSCRYALFDAHAASGTCQSFAAPGAVYPDVQTFARVVDAMLRPAAIHQPVSMYRLPTAPPAPLRDADQAVDLLTRWQFECDVPKQRYSVGFRGKVGEITESRCRQYSLRTPGRPPQSQDVVVRYDTADLAVLGIEVRLDDATATLSQLLISPLVSAVATPTLGPTFVLDGPNFEIAPIKAVDTVVTGHGPVNLPIVIVDVTYSANPLGNGTISDSGSFTITLSKPAPEGHSIGIQVVDVAGSPYTPTQEFMAALGAKGGPGFRYYPTLGPVYVQVKVEP